MAQRKKKSQADKAVTSNKGILSFLKKPKSSEPEQLKMDMNPGSGLPVKTLCGLGCLLLFVVLLIVLIRPDGALIIAVKGLIYGFFGSTGFLFLVPVSLIYGIILLVTNDKPIVARSICLFTFVLCCGSISHLMRPMPEYSGFFGLIGTLFTGGVEGTTGGLICGGIAMLLEWGLGTAVSLVILFVLAVLTILGVFSITLPSLIAAFRSRPRAEWEVEKKPKQDPAEVVVHTIAAKRIEYVSNKRKLEAERAIEAETNPEAKPNSNRKNRVSSLIRQIAGDVDSPVASAGVNTAAEETVEKVITEPAPAPAAEPPVNQSNEADYEEPEIITQGLPKRQIPAYVPEMTPDATPVNKPAPDIPVDAVIPAEPEKITRKEARQAAIEVAVEIAESAAETKPEYSYPPISLLKLPPKGASDGTMEMRENSRRLNETLASFKIDAHIVNVTRGPSVTRYEVELEKGVRLNKLTSAADDIALSLGATGVRIAAVPDKISVVGIEVPNKIVTKVSLREVIDSRAFTEASSRSAFAVGKNISGDCIVGNIAKLPHMLIAGTTGSGKSVCMNSIIISLLYKASPEDVKLIMVDPKMVELGIYNGIPHLLIPVVTDPKKAAGSLQWAVTEMLRRYRAMSDMGVRDLESYNSIIVNQEIEGEKLPQIVVIIDELADLMLVAAKEVEESICRIAQMGRAAGIHLVIATQRPSADVITGLMKANIPSRIAFSVASAMESRIILDTQGAEKLVGRGDMLFAPIGTGKPQRVQGCFVTDEEVERVASYVKDHYNSNYDESVMEEIEKTAAQTGNSKGSAADPEPNAEELDGDEMLPQAVDVILETGQASVSMLQRRLKLGYARAARIVDEMEEKGIVGPFQGSKPRAILISKGQWEAMRSGAGSQMDFDDLDDGPEELL